MFLLLVVSWRWKNGQESMISPWRGKLKTEDGQNLSVVGFLPTWMVGKTRTYGGEVSHLVFLGIEVDDQGDLIWDTQSRKINNDNYRKLKESVKRGGGKNIIGIKLFNDKKISRLLASEEARKRLVDQVKAVVEVGNFDGVNVDFEYMNDPVATLEDELYRLILEMKTAGVGEISLDVFANTVIKGEKLKLQRMVKLLDQMVVMAYDFHTSGSNYVGPVAPIQAPIGERSIQEAVNMIKMNELPMAKMVLAFPLYGYEWKTETDQYGSKVESYVQMVSVARSETVVKKAREASETAVRWDEISRTPWLSFVDVEVRKWTERIKVGRIWKNVAKSRKVEVIHQIYYENIDSLGEKFKLARDNKLGGVGFWALGYEGTSAAVWEELAKVMSN